MRWRVTAFDSITILKRNYVQGPIWLTDSDRRFDRYVARLSESCIVANHDSERRSTISTRLSNRCWLALEPILNVCEIKF